jgi:ABC-type hemin transport system substrate-binding protein
MASFKFSFALIILLLIQHKALAQQEMRIVSAGGSITEIL